MKFLKSNLHSVVSGLGNYCQTAEALGRLFDAVFEGDPFGSTLTVSHSGELERLELPPRNNLTPSEAVDGACRVLNLSEDPLHKYLAYLLEKRWARHDFCNEVHESYYGRGRRAATVRLHIAIILAIHRSIHTLGSCGNKVDYALLSLAQGDEGAESYVRELIPKWEKKAFRE